MSPQISKAYDFTVQAINLNQAKEDSETAVVFFISLVSAILEKPVLDRIVVLGEMSIRGLLLKVASLPERMQLAVEAGASASSSRVKTNATSPKSRTPSSRRSSGSFTTRRPKRPLWQWGWAEMITGKTSGFYVNGVSKWPIKNKSLIR